MAKIKDTNYLYITSVIRAKEPRLITGAQLDRMIEAKSDVEALRVLEECGFDDLNNMDSVSVQKRLDKYLGEILDEIGKNVPDYSLINIFRLKYDYHNAKVLIKSQAAGIDGTRIMSTVGRYTPEFLNECFVKGVQETLTPEFFQSIIEAKNVLARTNDAQQADFILDRAYFGELCQLADCLESEFVHGYCKLSIDIANLRTAVRATRMGVDSFILQSALIDGGNTPVSSIMANHDGDGLYKVFSDHLTEAAERGFASSEGGSLTLFEKACDNALINYLKEAKMVSFGEAPVVAFIASVEAEITAVRIVISSRKAGIASETIRERLRDSYV